VSINVNTYGTSQVDDLRLAKAVNEVFDCRPAEIIKRFDLKRPIYKPTAAYGHFGREEFPWEKLDFVDQLKSSL
jgi:S-adenosylmethionine synthetase